MIVRMKKVTLLAPNSGRDDLLLKLRRLGVAHVKHVVRPFSKDITSLEATISKTGRAISILEECRIPKEAERVTWEVPEIPEKAEGVVALASEKDEQIKDLQYIKNRMEEFKPWGAFDPNDIRVLQGKNIEVRLYRTTKKILKRLLKEKKNIHIISEDRQYTFVAQISEAGEEPLSIEEVKLPKESFKDVYERHESVKKRIEEIEVELRTAARALTSLRAYSSNLETRNAFLSVKHGMKEEGIFSYLQGYCPLDRVKDIVDLAKQEELGYAIEDPHESEEIPTLIRNPMWIRIISPVFKFMNVIPGYKEYDISIWFLIFFSIFFAMIIGDAGYGVLFLVMTLFAKKRVKAFPREPFFLMCVLSVATILWGAATGTWFGSEKIAQMPFLNTLVVGKIDSFVEGNQNFMIYLCFVIGVIHLTIAHLIIALKIINSLKAIAQVGWVLVLWGLFFAAGTLVIGRPFPAFGGYALALGAMLILLFSNPQKNIIKGMLISLSDLPLKLVSSFSDVVSYLRLFAVGYASCVVASSFNDMALQLGFNSIAAGFGAAFILFFGHALNIILGLMAIIVHGIRLNMLEFSGQMSMEWSGIEYDPFRESTSEGEIKKL